MTKSELCSDYLEINDQIMEKWLYNVEWAHDNLSRGTCFQNLKEIYSYALHRGEGVQTLRHRRARNDFWIQFQRSFFDKKLKNLFLGSFVGVKMKSEKNWVKTFKALYLYAIFYQI